MTRREELIWAAGLFEGEGYIHVSTNKSSPHPQIGLNMNDEDVVVKFAAVMGMGKIRTFDPRKQNPNAHIQYRWRVTSWPHFHTFTDLLYEFLGARRQFTIDLARDQREEMLTEVAEGKRGKGVRA